MKSVVLIPKHHFHSSTLPFVVKEVNNNNNNQESSVRQNLEWKSLGPGLPDQKHKHLLELHEEEVRRYQSVIQLAST